MLKGNQLLEEFQKNVQEFIAQTPAADVEKNIKAFMAQGFAKMNLVSREEFDQQITIVNNLRERITSLESKVAELIDLNAANKASDASSHDQSTKV